MSGAPVVELLWWEGCPSHPNALADLERILTEEGLSGPVSTPSIESTDSIPSATRPKTVCLPSSQDASSLVTMKNWLPFVSGPLLAIARAPRTTL